MNETKEMDIAFYAVVGAVVAVRFPQKERRVGLCLHHQCYSAAVAAAIAAAAVV